MNSQNLTSELKAEEKKATHTEQELIERYSNPVVANQLLAALEKRIESNPTNVLLLSQKAMILRRIAKLEQALLVYKQILALEPHNEYAHRSAAVLSGSPLPVSKEKGSFPAPFVAIPNFLPDSKLSALYQATLENEKYFKPSGVGATEPHYDPDKRQSFVWGGIGEWRPFMKGLLRERLPQLCESLCIDTFEPGSVEVKITNYLNGGFFITHADNSISKGKTGRAISYLLYYHSQPKAFQGGDLFLFDSDLSNERYTNANFTRIRCQNNTLVAFNSPYFHAVQPVRLESERFDQGRMALGGHINYMDTEDSTKKTLRQSRQSRCLDRSTVKSATFEKIQKNYNKRA
ncbi:2OG-Fe(II) oxygenase [Puniceicoccaceae bacterium K14]|nr:2OG-Fe(II) oxygenase [Puniceicoccaceae bacterium K14]